LTFCVTQDAIAQKQDTYPLINLKSKNLKGKIKSIREKAYHAVLEEGKIYKGSQTKHRPFENNSFEMYNEKGNIILEMDYNWANNFEQRVDYQYDSITGDLLGSYENGFLFQGKYLHNYDDKSKLITTTMYDKEDTILVIYTHEYNENDNEIRCFGKGIADYMTDEVETATYDKQGNLLQTKKKTDRSFVIENMENDLLVERKEFEDETEEKLTKHEKYEYDEHGNEIKILSFDATGKLRSTQKKTFDEHNNQIGKQFFNSNNELEVTWTAEMVYDEFGNWKQQLLSRNGKAISILEREIEYYD